MASDLQKGLSTTDDDALSQRVRFGELYDVYYRVLTEKQRDVCERLLSDDVSLAELANETGITRQGAHDIVKRTRAYLEDLENALGLQKLLKERTEIVDASIECWSELPEKLKRLLADIDDRAKAMLDI